MVRTYLWAAPNSGSARRMLSFLSFMLSSMLLSPFKVRRPDIVIASSPQLLVGLTGWLLSRIKGIPFIFEVRDLWPESMVAVGMKENTAYRALKAIARFLYCRSDRIVTVGNGYKDDIIQRYGTPESKIQVIPNGIDSAHLENPPDIPDLRDHRGWKDPIVFMDVGTHGMAHGLTALLDAADIVRDEPRIRIALVGDGAEKAALIEYAARLKLDNVAFIDSQPKDRIFSYYNACDVGLVMLRDDPLFKRTLPSKMFEYMGMARPMIVSVGGEADKLCADADAGIAVPPGDPQALADALRTAASTIDALKQKGLNGQRYALARYSRTALAED